MKKFLLSLSLIIAFCNVNSQTTYYWVGGTGPVSFTSNSRWNTALNGSGTSRVAADSTDILIFDGTNIGGSSATTGTVSVTVSSTKCGQIKLVNNASVVMSRPTGGTAGTLTISGGTGDDFVINLGSTFSINSPSDSGAVNLVLQAVSTGLVSGNVNISNTATSRITTQSTGALVFTSTAVCTVSTTPATAGYPFGSATQGFEKGIVFMSGSKLICSSKYSPMGGTSSYQAIDFKTGSNYYIRSSNAASTGSWTNTKTLGNLFIQNGATFTADGPFNKIENLTIESGCSLITHTSGQTPVLGNLVVDGTLSAPSGSTNNLVMGGNTQQTISGSGTITVPTFVVANYSDVILQKNIVANTATNIIGKIDFGATNIISGDGTFATKVNSTATSVASNTVADSYQITGVPANTLSGVIGLTISGAGIQPNTHVVGFSAGTGYINLSKPTTATATGVSVTFSSNAATLATANPNGFNNINGCVTTIGTLSYASGTNYIINAPTTYPIGVSTTASTSMTIGNLELNAPVSTNYNMRVNGSLNLQSGKFTITAGDTVRIFNGNNIGGSPFSIAKYIVTSNNGTETGVLRIDTFNTAKLFPIGTTTDYLPVTITPTDFSNFCVSAFNGVTSDATLTGTAFSASQKQNIVDGVWLINRTKGTGIADIKLNWTDNLEGSTFLSLADNLVGISAYDGTNWSIAKSLTANNTQNFATDTFSNFQAFAVGKFGDILPVKFLGVNSSVKNSSATINWFVANEINVEKYYIERSSDGRNYNKIAILLFTSNAEGKYEYSDLNLTPGIYFYRIVAIDKSGKKQYSSILKVSIQTEIKISVYPNPTSNEIIVSGIETGSILKIIDISGKIVFQKIANSQVQTLDISKLPNGNYSITNLTLNGKTNSILFIKK